MNILTKRFHEILYFVIHASVCLYNELLKNGHKQMAYYSAPTSVKFTVYDYFQSVISSQRHYNLLLHSTLLHNSF